jgi:hypothetical protein
MKITENRTPDTVKPITYVTPECAATRFGYQTFVAAGVGMWSSVKMREAFIVVYGYPGGCSKKVRPGINSFTLSQIPILRQLSLILEL